MCEPGIICFSDVSHCLNSSCHDSCVCAKSLQSRLTLCDPMDCSPPGSSVLGILQARILEWVCHALPQGDLPDPGRESTFLTSPALTGSLPLAPPGKPFPLTMAAEFQGFAFLIPFSGHNDYAFQTSGLGTRVRHGFCRYQSILSHQGKLLMISF